MKKGRVIEVHRTNYTVNVDGTLYSASVRGAFHEAGDFPKVGDYVRLEILNDDQAVVDEVCERTSVIKRKAAHTNEEQIIAANVDIMFIVMGLDGDYNLSRLERYLLLAEQSGVPAVVILNKLDVVDDLTDILIEAESAAGDTPVELVSATTDVGMEDLLKYFKSDTTAVLLGSSGAGKSTITNWLLGEERQAVQGIREDDSHGRHTTTSRELFTLPTGGYLIDTPGMRELGLVDSEEEAEQKVFERIENIAINCKFRNCDHDKSEGCAVKEAIEAGELTERELNNYKKLIREREFHEDKIREGGAYHQKQKQKQLSKKIKTIMEGKEEK